MGFDRVLPGFTGFPSIWYIFLFLIMVLYWVLLVVTRFYCVLPGFTGFNRVLLTVEWRGSPRS